MSTGKLDQSLDDILQTRRSSNRRGNNKDRRPAGPKKPATTKAPVGGVKKTTKQPKGNKAVPTGPSGYGESKIIVSNLPLDVEEQQLKEYFTKTIGNIKRVMLTFGPNGQSRGTCTVIFNKLEAAAAAAKELDGVKVDNRPMKVEVVYKAQDAPAPPPAKTLADRVSQPKQAKAQPKPATTTKGAAKGTASRGRGNKRGGRGGRASRAPKKTAEELDAEMVDYFDGGAGNADGDAMVTNGGAVQAPAAGDTGMDEML